MTLVETAGGRLWLRKSCPSGPQFSHLCLESVLPGPSGAFKPSLRRLILEPCLRLRSPPQPDPAQSLLGARPRAAGLWEPAFPEGPTGQGFTFSSSLSPGTPLRARGSLLRAGETSVGTGTFPHSLTESPLPLPGSWAVPEVPEAQQGRSPLGFLPARGEDSASSIGPAHTAAVPGVGRACCTFAT